MTHDRDDTDRELLPLDDEREVDPDLIRDTVDAARLARFDGVCLCSTADRAGACPGVARCPCVDLADLPETVDIPGDW